jgi:hypothetical protein
VNILAQLAKLSVLVQAVEASADTDESLDKDTRCAVEVSVPPRSKRDIPAADPAAVGAGGETPSRKQRIRMRRRLEGAIANRRADAKLPGAARLRRNWFCGVVSIDLNVQPQMSSNVHVDTISRFVLSTWNGRHGLFSSESPA